MLAATVTGPIATIAASTCSDNNNFVMITEPTAPPARAALSGLPSSTWFQPPALTWARAG
ncbi:hypothetical protein GCM10018963_60180 [Saccharothrix longispora]